MYRGSSNKDNFKCHIMKNSREKDGEILKDWIDDITYIYQECNEMTLEVPNKTVADGLTVYNPVFDKLRGKRQQIVINDKERYVIEECNRSKDSDGNSTKKIKAYSFEKTLEESDFITDSITRQLYYKEGDTDIAEGILNFFEEDNPSWTIGYVSELVRKETTKLSEEIEIDVQSNLEIKDVKKGIVLWEKSFTNVNPYDENSIIEVRILYNKINSYDKSGKLLKEEKEIHDSMGKLYTGVKHIKAEYVTSDEYRYAVKYTFTLTDDIVIEKIQEFTNIDAMDIKIDNIKLFYTNGNMIERTATRYRSFEENSYKWLTFLRNEVQKAYDCVFIFDTFNKVVNCYHKDEYGVETGLYMSYENFIKDINVKDQYEEVVTKLYVKSDKTSIAEENPLGTDYILDYTYFVKNGIMSDELQLAWKRYEKNLEGKQTSILEIRAELNTYNKKKIKLETKRLALEEEIKGLEVIRNVYMKEKDEANTKRLSEEINRKQDEFELIMKDIEACKVKIEELSERLKTLVQSITIDNATDEVGKIFTKEDINEITDLTITQELTDEFYSTPYGLYSNAKEIMTEKNKLAVEFEVSITGLSEKLGGVTNWKDWIGVGNYAYIDDDDIVQTVESNKLRIIKYRYIPFLDDVDSIEFANRDKKIDDLQSIGDVGSIINKTENYTNNYKQIWEESRGVNDYVDKMLSDYLDMASVSIRSRAGRCKLDFSEAGCYIIDSADNKAQLYFGSSMIGITNDRWLTCKTCIDQNGIIAQQLIGQIILGKELYITSELGDFYIGNTELNNGFGLKIRDDSQRDRIFLGTELENGVRKARFRLMNPDGRVVLISEDGLVNTDQYVHADDLDSANPMEFNHYVDSGVYEVRECKIAVTFQQFRATVKSLTSGGSVTTSSGGGGYAGTSGSGGYSVATNTSGQAGGFGETGDGGVITSYEKNGVGGHYHLVAIGAIQHSHPVSITIPSHSHSVNIPSHTHTLDTSHNHTLVAGIYLSTKPSNVILYVNGVKVKQYVSDGEIIDIKSHLNAGRMNVIKFTSSNLGRIQCTVYSKCFVGY